MKILSIETSCDETAVAIVEGDGTSFVVVENLVSSQIATHQQYGGVVPEVAARMHVPVLPLMIQALTQWKQGDFDAVAVTTGPGLATALRVGVETAKALAVTWGVSLVPVDHIEGHIYANFLDSSVEASAFPILCLVVSGGHTEIVLMKDHGEYVFLGQTRDDAAGEAFDKTAAQLGLSYPGGPSIAKAALGGDATAITLPRPMINSGDLDVSFSGLKTAVRNQIRSHAELTPTIIADIAASFQQAVVDVLVTKTRLAAEQYAPNTVMLCGGVSANTELRRQLMEAFSDTSVSVLVPQIKYTTDNAAMIGAAGLRALVDGRVAMDPLIIDADPAKILGGQWKWEL
ncbi:tRNA (adenosine(37)-N6)-threonylcarbamoyltransferase complex transferase subunit TsaD [Candidatus Uhrbacteria bacterium CG10_big_fil_rev_8_21_14_0_10_50_16]|uniref:tRNA N6-adenosine threonylcarbamoyltransferase n=1 Tax=Candidatus Uhrbacteria bacterium CG10_big_fil_rev_8_21_14_0_10_50_16 TaxID=1975039 RepID=A0A2H0RMN7_9BACT|nr:MAG: tRNA (adenosine(37)-N6)-threonylcarbamoyltransferase complex transferase subunit TsaD [Candidatus Uhrbacteria bacterium CG10_big_fil_rev_8_21_14_0_10_50_16]